MITENGKYYLYRHVRLDTGQPFYIGIGTKKLERNTKKSIYSRAYSLTRTFDWYKIVTITSYRVDILLESDDFNFIKQKEREFINLYDNLINVAGNIRKLKPKELLYKKPKKKNPLKRGSKGNIVYQYDLDGNFIKEWGNCREAAKFYNRNKHAISKVANINIDKPKSTAGFLWSYEFLNKLKPLIRKSSKKAIGKFDKEGNLLESYENAVEASLSIDGTRTYAKYILNCCKGVTQNSKGFIWKFI